jgi:hypothetical protein
VQAPQITRQLHTTEEQAHLTEAGRGSVAVVPSGPFRAADGWVMLYAYVPKHWHLLTACLERTDLGQDPRFVDQDARARHAAELTTAIEEALSSRTVAEWVEIFAAAGVMASPVQTWRSVIHSSAFLEAGLAVTVGNEDRTETVVRTPARYRAFRPAGNTPTPRLGEHTNEVLGSLRSAGGSADNPPLNAKSWWRPATDLLMLTLNRPNAVDLADARGRRRAPRRSHPGRTWPFLSRIRPQGRRRGAGCAGRYVRCSHAISSFPPSQRCSASRR